jgi:hypothetical protein
MAHTISLHVVRETPDWAENKYFLLGRLRRRETWFNARSIFWTQLLALRITEFYGSSMTASNSGSGLLERERDRRGCVAMTSAIARLAPTLLILFVLISTGEALTTRQKLSDSVLGKAKHAVCSP